MSTDEEYDDDDNEEGEETREWVRFGRKLYWGKIVVCQVLGTVLNLCRVGPFKAVERMPGEQCRW